jgi:predicted dehydrogenase
MVGYEFMYDDRFVALAKLVDSGKMGRIDYIRCNLINACNVSASYADSSIIEHHTTHQLSMLQLLLGNHDIENLNVEEAQENFVRLNFLYKDTRIDCTTAVNYSKGCNLRKIEIVGSRLIVRLDYNNNQADILVYDASTFDEVKPSDPGYPEEFRKMEGRPNVSNELNEFFKCIQHQGSPVSSGHNAIHLVQLTEQINSKFIAT